MTARAAAFFISKSSSSLVSKSTSADRKEVWEKGKTDPALALKEDSDSSVSREPNF